MGVIVPVAASVAVFGHHTWAVALPMFIASVACVFLAVALGKLLFGWREGLLAGLIVSVLPYFRVLSTTAYADTHVCLWVTAAVVLCVLGLRAKSQKGRLYLLIACGFALGLGISSKVFAATALCGILAVLAQTLWPSPRKLIGAGIAIGTGGVLLFLVEGAFYNCVAGDFFFSLHAHEQTQAGVPGIAADNMTDTQRIGSIVWDRLTLLMFPSVSGWGLVGAAFWPVIALAFLHGGAADAWRSGPRARFCSSHSRP